MFLAEAFSILYSVVLLSRCGKRYFESGCEESEEAGDWEGGKRKKAVKVAIWSVVLALSVAIFVALHAHSFLRDRDDEWRSGFQAALNETLYRAENGSVVARKDCVGSWCEWRMQALLPGRDLERRLTGVPDG